MSRATMRTAAGVAGVAGVAGEAGEAGVTGAPMERRRFVGLCGRAVTFATGAAGAVLSWSSCASVAVRPVTPTSGRVRLSLADYPELAAPDGSVMIRPTGWDDPIYVLALGDRRFTALSPICTHRGCTVEIQGARLECPCHGSVYDRDGAVLHGPAERALAQFRTQVTSDGMLVIDLRVVDEAAR